MTYRFLGTESQFGDVKLDKFGQSFELEDDEAVKLIGHPRGVPAISEESFNEIGFTESELEQYQYPGPRTEAPLDFTRKYVAALQVLHALRIELAGGVQ